MKKIFVAGFVVLVFLTTPVSAHKWEWAAYVTSPKVNTVYIDSESVINVQNLFNVGDACVQALFKTTDGTIFFANFLRQGANFYFAVELVSPNALSCLNLPSSVAQQEQARFDELMARGVRASQAHRLVEYDRAKLREDLSRRYTEAIMTYGTNGNGSLNLLGVSLLYKMAQANLQGAGLFAQSLAFSPAYEPVPSGGLASDLYKSAVAKLMLSYR